MRSALTRTVAIVKQDGEHKGLTDPPQFEGDTTNRATDTDTDLDSDPQGGEDEGVSEDGHDSSPSTLAARLPPIVDWWQRGDAGWQGGDSRSERYCQHCCRKHTGYYHHVNCGHGCYGACEFADPKKCQTCAKNGFVGAIMRCEYCNAEHWGVMRTRFSCNHVGVGQCSMAHDSTYCQTCWALRETETKREEEERTETCDSCGEEVLARTMRFCSFCGIKQCGRDDTECFNTEHAACPDCVLERSTAAGRETASTRRGIAGNVGDEDSDRNRKRKKSRITTETRTEQAEVRRLSEPTNRT